VGTLALCPPYAATHELQGASQLCRDDAEFALIFQLYLTMAPLAKIAETLHAARFRQRLDSCAEYLVVDGQVVFSTVRHGFPDHHRGLFCRDVRMEKMIAPDRPWIRILEASRLSTASHCLWWGPWRAGQFWMLRVNQLKHLKMQTRPQVPKRLAQYPPFLLVEFKDS
jgi:hypothetical protein